MKVDELQPGPEIDLAVAEVIGMNILHICAEGCYYWARTEDGTAERLWRPSTDWNDAMEAAEKVDLFEWGRSAMLKRFEDRWQVEWRQNDDWHDGKAPTGPLAICRAILIQQAVDRDEVFPPRDVV